MNKEIKAQLVVIAQSLPNIEFRNQKVSREVLGWEIIEETKKQAEQNGLEYKHPTWPMLIKKGKDGEPDEIENQDIKPDKKYYYNQGNRKVDHYSQLVKMFRSNGWAGVEEYQKQVREIYSRVDG